MDTAKWYSQAILPSMKTALIGSPPRNRSLGTSLKQVRLWRRWVITQDHFPLVCRYKPTQKDDSWKNWNLDSIIGFFKNFFLKWILPFPEMNTSKNLLLYVNRTTPHITAGNLQTINASVKRLVRGGKATHTRQIFAVWAPKQCL